ncbi:MAG: hypothetical protein AAF845_11760 [Bacteroidota bacterium]
MIPDLPPVPEADPPFTRPRPLDLTFEGFPDEGFEALARLRAEPHIEQYRKEKDVLDRAITEPFKRYRDDLALNWVIPNRLPFETERNVFSRILKNDFGRGGSHSHLWMSFYRPPRKRLTDVQLSHSVHPDAFRWGIYAGDYSKGLFHAARDRMATEPGVALDLLNGLIDRGYRLAFAPRVTKPEGHPEFSDRLGALPEGLDRAKGIWLMRRISRAEAQALGPGLVAAAIDAQEELWPLYRFWAEAASGTAGEREPADGVG